MDAELRGTPFGEGGEHYVPPKPHYPSNHGPGTWGQGGGKLALAILIAIAVATLVTAAVLSSTN